MRSRSESESEQGEKLHDVDPKPDDLSMSRVKQCKTLWRPEHTPVEIVGDDLWIAEKFQSNQDIAGSPRNSFRASLL